MHVRYLDDMHVRASGCDGIFLHYSFTEIVQRIYVCYTILLRDILLDIFRIRFSVMTVNRYMRCGLLNRLVMVYFMDHPLFFTALH